MRRWRDIRACQLELLQHVLAYRTLESAPSASCALFQVDKHASNITRSSAQGSGAGSKQVPNTTPGSTSSAAQKKYTPVQGGAAPVGSSTLGLNPNNNSAGQSGSGVVIGTHVLAQAASAANRPLWIIFGAEGSMELQELGQISNEFLKDDQTFIQELRRQHRQVRGWARILFSMWRLRYWEFVKVGPLKLSQSDWVQMLTIGVRTSPVWPQFSCCSGSRFAPIPRL
jgi:hypothetical protein